MRRLVITLTLSVGMATPTVAVARRVATASTRVAIEHASLGYRGPQRCVLVYVTTKDGGNWATAAIKNTCTGAVGGLAIAHRTHGRWHLADGGSAFGCRELRRLGMPAAVRRDLHLPCLMGR